MNAVKRPAGKALGVGHLINALRSEFPGLVIGYFNLPEKDISRSRGTAKLSAR